MSGYDELEEQEIPQELIDKMNELSEKLLAKPKKEIPFWIGE